MLPINGNYTREHLEAVQKADLELVLRKDAEYGRSWLKRGGVGAYMMLARKWDRIEEQVKRTVTVGTETAYPWNIFSHIALDRRPEGLLDDIRDLRNYLLLTEAAILASLPSENKSTSLSSHKGDDLVTVRSETGRRSVEMTKPFGFDLALDIPPNPPADPPIHT